MEELQRARNRDKEISTDAVREHERAITKQGEELVTLKSRVLVCLLPVLKFAHQEVQKCTQANRAMDFSEMT